MPICSSRLIFPSSIAISSFFFHGYRIPCFLCLYTIKFTLEILPSFCDLILSFLALLFAFSPVLSLKTSRTVVMYFRLQDAFLCIITDKTHLLFPGFPFAGASSPCLLLGIELQPLNLHWLLFSIALNKPPVFRTLLSVPRLSCSLYRDSHNSCLLLEQLKQARFGFIMSLLRHRKRDFLLQGYTALLLQIPLKIYFAKTTKMSLSFIRYCMQ